jgi:hypothetical protein
MAVATGEPEELVQPAVLLVAVVLEDTLVPVAKVEEVLIPLHMQALPVLAGVEQVVHWPQQAAVEAVVAGWAYLDKAQMAQQIQQDSTMVA